MLGVGDYYGAYDPQLIFEQFKPEELAIIPMKFEQAFYCTRTQQMATSKTTPATKEERIHLSGTKVREMLCCEELSPPEFSRHPITAELAKAIHQSFIYNYLLVMEIVHINVEQKVFRNQSINLAIKSELVFS